MQSQCKVKKAPMNNWSEEKKNKKITAYLAKIVSTMQATEMGLNQVSGRVQRNLSKCPLKTSCNLVDVIKMDTNLLKLLYFCP